MQSIYEQLKKSIEMRFRTSVVDLVIEDNKIKGHLKKTEREFQNKAKFYAAGFSD